jgi:hypothetical protein
MGNARDVMWNTPGHAMAAWKERQAERYMLWALEEGERASSQHAKRERQAERPMQGPPTEIQMLIDEVKALGDRQRDHEYAQVLMRTGLGDPPCLTHRHLKRNTDVIG